MSGEASRNPGMAPNKEALGTPPIYYGDHKNDHGSPTKHSGEKRLYSLLINIATNKARALTRTISVMFILLLA